MIQTEAMSPTSRTEGADLSLEIIVLLIFGLFMALFGLLLLPIQRGALPYALDSTHGLFLVLLALQAITLGKTPFGDFRRSWLLVALGAGVAVVGMIGSFIPGLLREPLRLLVGFVLMAGGLTLLLGLLVARDKARLWLRGPAPLRHLTLAAGLVYGLALVAGLVTLFPGLLAQSDTAILLFAFGSSFFYLAWCLREVRRHFPFRLPAKHEEAASGTDRAEPPIGLSLMLSHLQDDASLSLAPAFIFLLAVLLSLLGILLVPVGLGLMPFSPDGQLGLLLVLMAIQMLTLGETPAGRFQRSGWLVAAGLGFAGAGIVACIVPGVLTGSLQILLGVLNLGGGLILLAGRLRVIEWRRLATGTASQPLAPPMPAPLRKLAVIQILLHLVSIGFGLSMLLPGVLPLPAISAILILNGALMFQLALILRQLDGAPKGSGPEPGMAAGSA